MPSSRSGCKALKMALVNLLMATRSFRKFVNAMALNHQWHNQARLELDETLAYVFREFGEGTAEKVYVEVEKRVRQLCIFPDSGIRYKDLYYNGKEVRIFHMRKSSIIYCHDDEMLYILAFWNNRNDDTNASEMLSEI